MLPKFGIFDDAAIQRAIQRAIERGAQHPSYVLKILTNVPRTRGDAPTTEQWDQWGLSTDADKSQASQWDEWEEKSHGT